MKTVAVGFLVTFLWACGCGSSTSKSDAAAAGTGPWLPLAVGDQWTYQVTDIDGTISAKTQSVTANELVGGVGDAKDMLAFKLVTGNKFADPNGDVSYQALVGTRYVRFRELSIDGKTGATKKEEYYSDPFKLRLDISDANTKVDAPSWIESYTHFVLDTPKQSTADADADAGATSADGGLVTTQTQERETWTVTAVDEIVQVPAGTFKALVVNRIANATNKSFWFVRGIGKVKETGIGDQTEELTTYTVAP